jgi:UDP-glucose 4-epimerase
VRDIAQQVAAAWSSEASIEFNGLARPGDPFSLVSNSRHLHELGFVPTVPVNEGIAAYVDWFREYRKE